jgi:hypothetical protein
LSAWGFSTRDEWHGTAAGEGRLKKVPTGAYRANTAAAAGYRAKEENLLLFAFLRPMISYESWEAALDAAILFLALFPFFHCGFCLESFVFFVFRVKFLSRCIEKRMVFGCATFARFVMAFVFKHILNQIRTVARGMSDERVSPLMGMWQWGVVGSVVGTY